MLFHSSIALTLLAVAVKAHFRIPYPGERNATNFDTQTTGPCGGANEVVEPRFEWNPNGSPLDLYMHHNESVGAIYFCGKDDCSTADDFDTLLYQPFDQIGAGNYCIPAFTLPEEFNVENQTGTIQVIFAGTGDNATSYDFMYNCLDIIVSEGGPTYDGSQCSNTTDVTIEQDTDLDEEVNSSNNEQLDSVTAFPILSEYFMSTYTQSTSSGYNEMSGMDMSGMDMSGMDMSGMDMGSSSTGDVTATNSGSSGSVTSSSSSDDMAGMDMGSSSGSSGSSSTDAASTASGGGASLGVAGGILGFSGLLFGALLL